MSSTVLLATALTSMYVLTTSMCVLTADLPVHPSAAWHNDHASNGSARLAPRRTTGDGAQKLAACLTTKPEDSRLGTRATLCSPRVAVANPHIGYLSGCILSTVHDSGTVTRHRSATKTLT